jgi:hypothetical protein
MKKFLGKKATPSTLEAAKEAQLRTLMGLEEGDRLPLTFHVESAGGLTKNSCTICCPVGSQPGDILVVTTSNPGEGFQIAVPERVKEHDKFEVNLNTYEPIYGIEGRDLPKPVEPNIITDIDEVNKPQYRRKPTGLARPSWGLEQMKVARSLSTDEANSMVRQRPSLLQLPHVQLLTRIFRCAVEKLRLRRSCGIS